MLGMGLATGWAVMTRGATAVICLPLLVAVALEHRAGLARWLPWLLLGGLPFAVLLGMDNLAHTGAIHRFPFTAQAAEISGRMAGQGAGAFAGNPVLGLAGLLFSPSRGLLIYSPFLLLAVPGAWRAWRSRDGLRVAIAVGALVTLGMNSLYTDWWGGSCWGPRRLMDLLPGLFLLGLDPAWRQGGIPVRLRAPLATLVGLAVLIQSLGFFGYDSRWDNRMEPHSTQAGAAGDLSYLSSWEANERMWQWTDNPPLEAARKLAAGTSQIGDDNQITLALGWRVQPPLPVCATLRSVDRYP